MTARLIMKMRVAEARAVAPDVVSLTFGHPRRDVLPPWRPGAHVDLRLPGGRVRQYSLVGDPDARATYRIAVKREAEGRGGSAWVHDHLVEGAEAHVSAPRNNFELDAGAGFSLLIAGGIGVTPILPMARALARAGQAFAVHACARSRAAMPLIDELEAACGPRLDTWFDGRRLDVRAAVAAGPDGRHVYVCGPARLLDAVRVAASEAGLPEANVHFEVFQAAFDESFVPEPFEAQIASTGTILHVPAERSLLAVLRDNRIALPSSCESGTCGTCVCGHKGGALIHRDAFLSAAARGRQLTTCVSRARGRVTLDL